MYDQSSILIVAALYLSLAVAIELGYRLGRKADLPSDPSRGQVNTVQSSLLAILGLMLAFTLSLALQRFDMRSAAVVDEANAIGTAYLRTDLLPAPIRGEAQRRLREYLDLRVEAGKATLVDFATRQAQLGKAAQLQAELWQDATRAVELDSRPVTSGLFIQALNELIDSNGRRNAALNRHVPEVVLFLLYGTFLLTGSIVGYASGVAGHRVSFVTYIMVTLIVLLVFIIIDLDRPRRGLIEVDQGSMIELQTAIAVPTAVPAAPLPQQ